MKIKFILIIFPVLFFSTVTNAQKKLFSLGAGPTVGLPFNKNFKTPLGASIIAKYGISKLGSLTGDITYLNTKSVNFSTPFSVVAEAFSMFASFASMTRKPNSFNNFHSPLGLTR